VTFSIVTNGTLLGEEEAQLLAAHDFDTYLSFDGVAAAQDLRGPGTFPVLDALLDRLARDRPHFVRERLTVGLTLTPANVCHLPESIAYFLRKGVAKITLSPIVTHDPSWAPAKIAVLEDAFAEVFRLCLRHYKRTGAVPLEVFRKSGGRRGRRPSPTARRADLLRADRPRPGRGRRRPGARVRGLHRVVPGVRFAIPAHARRRVAHGRLPGPAVSRVASRCIQRPRRQTGLFHGKRDKYSSYGRCGECRFLDECSVCPASTGNIPGNTDAQRIADFPCAYNLVALKYREKFPVQPTPLDILTGKVRAYGPQGRVQRRMQAAVRSAGPSA
jgi:hypothetical protein